MVEKSLFGWQGAKFYEQNDIQPLIPYHRWYVEVFFGSGVTLINKLKSEFEFANDKFSCLVAFWECVKSSRMARKLIRYVDESLDSRYLYERFREQDPSKLNIFDRAYRFIYLSSFGFMGYHDTWHTPDTHNMGKLKNFVQRFFNVGKRVWSIHERLREVIYTDFDFRDCINRHIPHKDKFFFVDPPYYNTAEYNRGFKQDLLFPDQWYVDLRNVLIKQHEGGSKYMITCDVDNPFLADMPDSITKTIERISTINKNVSEKGVIKSWVIMNYDINKCEKMVDYKEEKTGNFVML